MLCLGFFLVSIFVLYFGLYASERGQRYFEVMKYLIQTAEGETLFSYDISLKSLSALNKATCYLLSKSPCGNVLT